MDPAEETLEKQSGGNAIYLRRSYIKCDTRIAGTKYTDLATQSPTFLSTQARGWKACLAAVRIFDFAKRGIVRVNVVQQRRLPRRI